MGCSLDFPLKSSLYKSYPTMRINPTPGSQGWQFFLWQLFHSPMLWEIVHILNPLCLFVEMRQRSSDLSSSPCFHLLVGACIHSLSLTQRQFSPIRKVKYKHIHYLGRNEQKSWTGKGYLKTSTELASICWEISMLWKICVGDKTKKENRLCRLHNLKKTRF